MHGLVSYISIDPYMPALANEHVTHLHHSSKDPTFAIKQVGHLATLPHFTNYYSHFTIEQDDHTIILTPYQCNHTSLCVLYRYR